WRTPLGGDGPQRTELVAQARDLGGEHLIVLGLCEDRVELCASGDCESIRARDQEKRHGLGTFGTDGRVDPQQPGEVADRVARGSDRFLVGRAVRYTHGEMCCDWKERSRQLL